MITKCCGNYVAAFAKLSHLNYVRTATDENMSVTSVVALNFEKGSFAVATCWRSYLSICEVRWFEEGHGINITD